MVIIKSLKLKLMLYFSIIFVSFTIIFMLGSYFSSRNSLSGLAETLLNEKLEGDITSAGLYFEKYFGEVDFINGNLVYRDQKIIGDDHEMVDHISDELNVLATVFVKSGDDFKRVTTNIVKDDGKRAVGTYLGKDSAAYKPVMSGKDYFGDAVILGKEYLTVYRPLKRNSAIIGILFIGVSKEAATTIINEDSSRNLFNIALLAAACLIVAIVVIYLISARISSALIFVKDILKNISDFDLQFEGNSEAKRFASRKDEIGTMTNMLEKMQENLKSMIVSLASQTKKIEENSTNLAAISQEQFASAEELYDQSRNIESHTQNTAASVEEVTSGIEEVAASAQDVSTLSMELAEQVNEAEKVVNKGKEEIKTQQDMILIVNEQNNKAVQLVTNVSDKADNVQEIVNTISSIAEQTNLLALNAAIEAARAGEAGKGFAVVADEIRKLAEESQTASGNIEKILKTINISSVKANEAVQKTTGLFRDFKDISGNLVSEFNQISENMGNITQRVESLTGAAQEQSASSEEMSSSMDVSAKSIAEISDQLEVMTGAVEQQESSSKLVSNSAQELSMLVEVLENEIGRFRL